MNYIKPHMVEALKNHVLEKRSDTHYFMRKPGTGIYSLHVAEVGGHLVLTGDLNIGGPHGCISAGGYGFDWFSSNHGGSYLCSKFLRREWQWEVAKERIEWEVNELKNHDFDKDGKADIKAYEEILSCHTWRYGDPTEYELYDKLCEANIDTSDGVPGYDYPLASAGWLCAAQQRFAELYQARAVQ